MQDAYFLKDHLPFLTPLVPLGNAVDKFLTTLQCQSFPKTTKGKTFNLTILLCTGLVFFGQWKGQPSKFIKINWMSWSSLDWSHPLRGKNTVSHRLAPIIQLWLLLVVFHGRIEQFLCCFQGHYRFAQAYFELGFPEKAMAVNTFAQKCCSSTFYLLCQAVVFKRGTCKFFEFIIFVWVTNKQL